MSNVVFTSNQAEADVVAEIEQNYAERSGAMAAKVEALITAAARGDSWGFAREDLIRWATTSVTSPAKAESAQVLGAAKHFGDARALAEAVETEGGILATLLDEVAAAKDGVRAAAGARAARSVFDLYADNMTTRVAPLLAGESSVSLTDLWSHARAEAEGPENTEAKSHGGADATADHAHNCTCGESDGPESPELDVRTVPHAIRHATVFGALDSVSPGAGMILVAPHDPRPLLAQIEARYSGGFTVDYLQRSPDAWRLEFTRA